MKHSKLPARAAEKGYHLEAARDHLLTLRGHNISAYISADISAYISANISAYIGANINANISANISAYISANISDASRHFLARLQWGAKKAHNLSSPFAGK